MLANAAAVALLAAAALPAVLADAGQILTGSWVLEARALPLLWQLLLWGRCRQACLSAILGLLLWRHLRGRSGHGSYGCSRTRIECSISMLARIDCACDIL